MVKAETQGKVIRLNQIEQPMKSAFFYLSVRSAAKRPHHGVGRLQGHLFSLSETCFSIVGLCFVAFLPRVTFLQGHLLEGQLKQMYRLSKERLTGARNGAEWGERGTRKTHFSLIWFVPYQSPPLFPWGMIQSCDIQRNLNAPLTFSSAHLACDPEITSQALQNYKIGLKP